jgi:subtilase family serine protease
MRLARASVAAVAALLGLAGTLAATTPAAAGQAAAAPMRLAGSAAPALPAGATSLGALPAQTRLTVDVGLAIRNAAGLDTWLAGLANQKSPYFKKFVGPAQFGALFGLTTAQLATVTEGLRSLGLSPAAADPNRLIVSVTATAAEFDRAFGITELRYRLADGRIAYANSAAPRVPAALAPYIQGVAGLSNLYLPSSMSVRAPSVSGRTAAAGPAVPAATGPRPCTAAVDAAVKAGAYTADEVANHYTIAPLYAQGDRGQGVHVALAELDPNLASDITTYKTCYGITTPISYITVAPGVGTGAGLGEAAIDIEGIAGIAPGATIDVYQAPIKSVTAILDIARRVVNRNVDRVFADTWGECEADAGSSLIQQYQAEFKAAAMAGITVTAATAFHGSTACYNPSATNPSKALSTLTPSSSNFVLAVGATTMPSAGMLSTERVWNGSALGKNSGASGGGVSNLCMPFYQDLNQLNSKLYPAPIPGVISKLTKSNPPCANPGSDPHGYKREVPDLSADGDPNTGYAFLYNGAWGGWGGTSTSAILVAAMAALIDASPLCGPQGWQSGAAGLFAPGVYAMTSLNLPFLYKTSQLIWRDVTSGNNDFTPSGYTGGLYPATKGYDMATGLGSPLLTALVLPRANPGLAAFMCHYFGKDNLITESTISASPRTAKAGHKVTLTIRGKGYVTIPGAVFANINFNNNLMRALQVNVHCASRTTCTLTLPGSLPARAYQINLYVNGFGACRTCSQFAKFTFVKP